MLTLSRLSVAWRLASRQPPSPLRRPGRAWSARFWGLRKLRSGLSLQAWHHLLVQNLGNILILPTCKLEIWPHTLQECTLSNNWWACSRTSAGNAKARARRTPSPRDMLRRRGQRSKPQQECACSNSSCRRRNPALSKTPWLRRRGQGPARCNGYPMA